MTGDAIIWDFKGRPTQGLYGFNKAWSVDETHVSKVLRLFLSRRNNENFEAKTDIFALILPHNKSPDFWPVIYYPDYSLLERHRPWPAGDSGSWNPIIPWMSSIVYRISYCLLGKRAMVLHMGTYLCPGFFSKYWFFILDMYWTKIKTL